MARLEIQLHPTVARCHLALHDCTNTIIHLSTDCHVYVISLNTKLPSGFNEISKGMALATGALPT